MANEEQLAILKQGVDVWNKWREDNPDVEIDLSHANLVDLNLSHADLTEAILISADLSNTNLTEANLYSANLNKANLNGANLRQANLIDANLIGASLIFAKLVDASLWGANLVSSNLSGTHLTGANFFEADLTRAILHFAILLGAKLQGANLSGATLAGANLQEADFYKANLSGANLQSTLIVETVIQDTILKNCRIYGISVWDPIGTAAIESGDFIITPLGQPEVTVDDIEVAQFVYLLLNNKKIRNVLDTIGKKGVLILGRFSPERKKVLDALRDKLRTLDFVPMMFDFEGATTKDFTETVKILAGMCRFIIADITNPKSSPLELQATVPDYKVPFVPIIQEGEEPFSMFANLQNYPWMFDVLQYKDCEQLLAVIDKAIIQPALIRADELNVQKAEAVRMRHAEDYLK